MSATIKISDDQFFQQIKATSKIQTRSIGDQALHWMKIGFVNHINKKTK